MTSMLRLAPLALALALPVSAQSTKAIDDLLAADRAYSAASAKTDVVSGLTAMFADLVTMPLPNRTWANGVEEVRAALNAVPDNAKSRAEWTPVGAGVSADGTQGYTFGYMTVRRPDSSVVPMKYLAYWARGPRGWRVFAYKRNRRPEGEVSMAMLPLSLPASPVPPSGDLEQASRFQQSLAGAEQAFSDEAQRIGLGPAFAKWGAPDAMNMGRGASFTLGAAEIARGMGDPPSPPSSPLSWKSDRVIVASSGDLGVSIGTIRSNTDPAAPPIPFFTVWRRSSPTAPWRYVAE